MVLDDVAYCSDLIVETTTALNTEILRHGNLHALDVVPIPEGFHERIGKAKNDHVVDWALSEVMVDAKDGGFVELAQQDRVEMFRGFQIVAERLFNDDASVVRAALLL